MSRSTKVKVNDPCPCGSGKKYKKCCAGHVDWNELRRSGADFRRHLSVRGRNIYFANRIGEALQFDKLEIAGSLSDYKAAFTKEAVREIHEAAMEAWPPDIDIFEALRRDSADVSGLYIGDYSPEYLSRAIVRHSIYANKILVVDPFIYPSSVRDEFNPILNPEQYRAQTLKNVNFYFSLMPWVEAGIVELIRTPDDFDRKLKWDSLKHQEEKFKQNEELKKALEISAEEMRERHLENEAFHHLILSAPDSSIRNTFREIKGGKEGLSEDDFIRYIHSKRAGDPNFLEPLGPDSTDGQLHTSSSGANYEIAKLTAGITGSYLFTDLTVKWKEIELDRTEHSATNTTWTPFAKSIQNSSLKYLNALSLEHALRLRKEGRLEGLRGFLHGVWREACTGDPFDEGNAETLALELEEEIRKAEAEWQQISQDLIKIIGAQAVPGVLSAGPLIASGHGAFVAAAAVIGTAATTLWTEMKVRGFPDKFPAAFFMNIEN